MKRIALFPISYYVNFIFTYSIAGWEKGLPRIGEPRSQSSPFSFFRRLGPTYRILLRLLKKKGKPASPVSGRRLSLLGNYYKRVVFAGRSADSQYISRAKAVFFTKSFRDGNHYGLVLVETNSGSTNCHQVFFHIVLPPSIAKIREKISSVKKKIQKI